MSRGSPTIPQHEGSASDRELESVLILKKLFCTVGQKQKRPSLCHFFTDFDEIAHEGSASDGRLESVLILKKLFCAVGKKLIF